MELTSKEYRNPQTARNTPPVARSWAAGFFDGEGCFSLSQGRFIVVILQVDPEVLLKFAQIMGVGNVRGPYDPPSYTGRPYYRYQVSGGKAKHVARVMWPYLGTIKRNQSRLAVDSP